VEVLVLPVADVDRSKAFYARLGVRLDTDASMELAQLPPHPAKSVQAANSFGTVSGDPGRGVAGVQERGAALRIGADHRVDMVYAEFRFHELTV
jgi:catechol 2,3-dioxygenase-like lactoylglutathione lyase family enzyme